MKTSTPPPTTMGVEKSVTKAPRNESTELPFMKDDEIICRKIIRYLKMKKTPGHDGIMDEQIIHGGEVMIKELTEIFDKIKESGKVSEDWKNIGTILVPKKCDEHTISNYGPVCLVTTIHIAPRP